MDKAERKSILKLIQMILNDGDEGIDVSSLNGNVIEAARQNDKRPAYMKTYVPDSWVPNLCYDPERQDLYVILRLTQAALEPYKDWKFVDTP